MSSLLEEMMMDCVIINKIIVDDDDYYGGQKTRWEEGAHFKAAISFDNSTEAKIAEKQGVTGFYTIGTSRDLILDFHDVIKILDTEQILRVTSKGEYKKAPESSSFDLRFVTAEEWSLPNG